MADAHIKDRTWTNNPYVRGDSYAALRKIKSELEKFSKEDRPDTVVIGGDWFDSNRPTATDVQVSIDFLKDFRQVYYIRGNHDKVNPSFLELLDQLSVTVSVTELTPDMLYSLDSVHNTVRLTGMSWMESREGMQQELRKMADTCRQQETPSVLYVVLHTSFKHLMPFGWKLEEADIRRIFEGVSVRILAGDIHTRHTLDLGDGNCIHSPGSLYPTSIDKAGQNSCVSIIDTATGGIEDLECNVRSYYSEVYEDLDTLCSLITDVVAHNTYSLEPYLRVNMPADNDTKILQSSYPGIIIQAFKQAPEQEQTPEAAARRDTYTLDQAIEEEATEDADICDLALALLHADDPVLEISSWLEFWKVERIV